MALKVRFNILIRLSVTILKDIRANRQYSTPKHSEILKLKI